MPKWSKIHAKSIQNPSKIYLKRHLKQDTILNRSWRALGWIWGRFSLQVGGQIGTKLAPKSEKWGSQDDVKKRAQKQERGVARGGAGNGRVGPYKYISPPLQDSHGALDTLTSALRALWRIYMYIDV